MQDIVNQWPILSLLPMCTSDAGLSIVSAKQSVSYPVPLLEYTSLGEKQNARFEHATNRGVLNTPEPQIYLELMNGIWACLEWDFAIFPICNPILGLFMVKLCHFVTFVHPSLIIIRTVSLFRYNVAYNSE